MNWTYIYLGIGACATVVTLGTTPLCRMVAARTGLLDRPLGEHHKQHRDEVPLLGGVAMFCGWFLTLAAGLGVVCLFGPKLPTFIADSVPGITSVLPLMGVIAGAGLALTVMGLLDDKTPFGPYRKLAGQIIICGIAAFHWKLRITLFWDVSFVTWMMTLCWLIFIVNAFNFCDNMDGLAAGIAVITASLFTVVAAVNGQVFVAAIGAVTAGTSLGFYFFNRAPASIFMGDSGSHFIGFMLGVLGALTLFYKPPTQTMAPLLIPVLILALPIFDAFAVIFIRVRQKHPIMAGDHNHISHRFVRLGMKPRTAVMTVHLLTLAIGLGALTLLWLDTIGVILILLQTLVLLVFVSIIHRYPITQDAGHGTDNAP